MCVLSAISTAVAAADMYQGVKMSTTNASCISAICVSSVCLYQGVDVDSYMCVLFEVVL
jgi:hypothetical protein